MHPSFQIEERLRQLKSDNNEIDHGSEDDVAAAKAAAADGSGNNGLLGHWGEQKRWRRLGPKKQRKLKFGERGKEGTKRGLKSLREM